MGEKPTAADEAAEEQKNWLPGNFRREAEGAQEARSAGLAVSAPADKVVLGGVKTSEESLATNEPGASTAKAASERPPQPQQGAIIDNTKSNNL